MIAIMTMTPDFYLAHSGPLFDFSPGVHRYPSDIYQGRRLTSATILSGIVHSTVSADEFRLPYDAPGNWHEYVSTAPCCFPKGTLILRHVFNAQSVRPENTPVLSAIMPGQSALLRVEVEKKGAVLTGRYSQRSCISTDHFPRSMKATVNRWTDQAQRQAHLEDINIMRPAAIARLLEALRFA